MPTSDAYDRRHLLEAVDGDAELACELALLYLSCEPGLVSELRLAVSVSDAARIQRACHTLRGMLGQIRAEHAAGLAEAIEDRARSAPLTGIAPLVDDLDRSLDVVRAALSTVR